MSQPSRSDEEIIAFSKTVPGYYDEDELRRLLALTRSLPPTATIVEIGVECGRSASIYLQCPENWQRLWLVDARTHNAPMGRRWTAHLVSQLEAGWDDPYTQDVALSEKYRKSNVRWDILTEQHGIKSVYLSEHTSVDVATAWDESDGLIDLLHIDADHGPEVWNDLRLWLPKVRVGGWAVMHDYERKGADGLGDVFPEVTTAVRHFVLSSPSWDQIDVVNTQLSAQRIA